jgi:hypothetical protein
MQLKRLEKPQFDIMFGRLKENIKLRKDAITILSACFNNGSTAERFAVYNGLIYEK